MIAKYDAACFLCHQPMQAGVDIYDPDQRRSYHQECFENQPPSWEQIELADWLGYRHFSWAELREKMNHAETIEGLASLPLLLLLSAHAEQLLVTHCRLVGRYEISNPPARPNEGYAVLRQLDLRRAAYACQTS
jgi:hypothetical protein